MLATGQRDAVRELNRLPLDKRSQELVLTFDKLCAFGQRFQIVPLAINAGDLLPVDIEMGMAFAAIYRLRGLGIAVYAHAIYDIIVTVSR